MNLQSRNHGETSKLQKYLKIHPTAGYISGPFICMSGCHVEASHEIKKARGMPDIKFHSERILSITSWTAIRDTCEGEAELWFCKV